MYFSHVQIQFYMYMYVYMYIHVRLHVCVGDQVTRKGLLSGGYHDTRKSKLENQRMITELRGKIEQLHGEKSTITRQLQDVSKHTCTCRVYWRSGDLKLCDYVVC